VAQLSRGRGVTQSGEWRSSVVSVALLSRGRGVAQSGAWQLSPGPSSSVGGVAYLRRGVVWLSGGVVQLSGGVA
jgi:hypothetical protein